MLLVMQLDLDTNTAKNQIKRYSAGAVYVNEQSYSKSILVMPEHLSSWHITSLSELTVEDIVNLANLQPEIIILGTGSTLEFPAAEICYALSPQKIGLEIMDTGAACRTYAVLTSEHRNVLAALII